MGTQIQVERMEPVARRQSSQWSAATMGKWHYAIREGIQGALGAGWYVNLAADRSAVVAAMQDERVAW